MSQDSKKKSLSILVPLLAGIFIAKALWVGIDYKFLPKTGVDKEVKSDIKPLYYRYSLASKKDAPKPIVKQKDVIKKTKPAPKPLEIKKFVLRGIIYQNPKKGLATIEYLNKAYVLERGEDLEGFIVSKFEPKAVLFVKKGKSYKIKLFEQKEVKNKNSSQSVAPIKQKTKPKPKDKNQTKNDIKKDGDTTVLSKQLFNKYKKDFKLIRKNIGVSPVMQDNKLQGFRIRYIKKGNILKKEAILKKLELDKVIL